MMASGTFEMESFIQHLLYMHRVVSRCTCKMSFISHTATAPAVSSERFLGVPLGGGLKLRKPLDGVTRAQLVRFPRRYISTQARQRAVLCAAALNATCAAEQTQTVTRQSSTITIAPIQGKEKSPELDDGGTGFPPRDDGDGGGGGGGGGPNWSGGFFFFGLLAFLGFLKDKESEGPYKNERRKYAY